VKRLDVESLLEQAGNCKFTFQDAEDLLFNHGGNLFEAVSEYKRLDQALISAFHPLLSGHNSLSAEGGAAAVIVGEIKTVAHVDDLYLNSALLAAFDSSLSSSTSSRAGIGANSLHTQSASHDVVLALDSGEDSTDGMSLHSDMPMDENASNLSQLKTNSEPGRVMHSTNRASIQSSEEVQRNMLVGGQVVFFASPTHQNTSEPDSNMTRVYALGCGPGGMLHDSSDDDDEGKTQ